MMTNTSPIEKWAKNKISGRFPNPRLENNTLEYPQMIHPMIPNPRMMSKNIGIFFCFNDSEGELGSKSICLYS